MTDVLTVRGSDELTRQHGAVYLADASGGPMTLSLPEPASLIDLVVKKIDDTGNTVTLDAGSETVDGQQSITLTNQYAQRNIVSDGEELFTDKDTSKDSVQTDRLLSKSIGETAGAFPLDTGFVAVDHHNENVYQNTNPEETLNEIIEDRRLSGGGSIHIGPYDIGGIGASGTPIRIQQSVKLEGENIGALNNSAGGPDTHDQETNATRLVLANGANHNLVEYVPLNNDRNFFAGLSDMCLDGNRDENESGHTFYSDKDGNGNSADDAHFKNVWFRHAAEDGVHAEAAWGYKFTDCLFEGNAGDGIYLNGAQACITSPYIALNDGRGLNAGAGSHSLNVHATIWGNGDIGASLRGDRTTGFIEARNNDGIGVDLAANNMNMNIVAADSGVSGSPVPNVRVRSHDSTHKIVCGGGENVNQDLHIENGQRNVITAYFGEVRFLGYAQPGNYLNVINGWAYNNGNPASTGVWNGNESFAWRTGATVYDNTVADGALPAYKVHETASGGYEWRQVSTTAA